MENTEQKLFFVDEKPEIPDSIYLKLDALPRPKIIISESPGPGRNRMKPMVAEQKKEIGDLLKAVEKMEDMDMVKYWEKRLRQESVLDTTFFSDDSPKKRTVWQWFKAWKIWHLRVMDIRDYQHHGDLDY